MSTLEIRGLEVSVKTDKGDIEILKGVDLTIRSGANQHLPIQLPAIQNTQLLEGA
jgi:Fe-S cluster assembly ATPase SufC